MPNETLNTNKGTILRLVDANNRQDAAAAAAAACFASESKNHGRVADPVGMAEIYRNLYAAFPDYRWKIESIFAESD